MTRSTDPEMNVALEADAEKLEALGQHAGPEVEDVYEDDFVHPYDDGMGPQYGCVHCGYEAWRHGCCDDMCRSCYEPEDCPDAIPCRHCNPGGDL